MFAVVGATPHKGGELNVAGTLKFIPVYDDENIFVCPEADDSDQILVVEVAGFPVAPDNLFTKFQTPVVELTL
jgi:hypothetical protein